MPRNATSTRLESTGLAALLLQTIDRIQVLGSGFTASSSRLTELRQRLLQGRFHLAVLGQFKRGKSTLLNALLGEEVLPMALVPLTAIPTFIQYGQVPQAKAYFQDERQPKVCVAHEAGAIKSFLSRFVTEQGNPRNQLGLSYVEVAHPAAILHSGVVLIDTPGIGSTFRHNTEMTLNFLHKCDAALFLVSADPLITEVEVSFLQHTREKITRLFFALNKVDYLSLEDRRQAVDFLREVLVEQAGLEENIPILSVSARQGLAARLAADSPGWQKSGMAEVERQLIQFSAHEKSEVLCAAIGQRAGDLLGEIIMRLQLAIRSLQMPLQDLQQRLGSFEQKIKEVKQERERAADLLAGDHKRELAHLEKLAEQLRGKTCNYLEGVLKEGGTPDPDRSMSGKEMAEHEAQTVLAAAIPGYFEHQRGLLTELINEQMDKVLRFHQQRADLLIGSIRKTAADLFEVGYRAPKSEESLWTENKPYWVTRKWSSTLSPIPESAIERLLPPGVRKQRIQKRLTKQIENLVCHNVENLRWAIYQNINQTFWNFGSVLDQRLAATLDATHGAIRVAMTQRQQHSQSVSREVSRLESVINDLMEYQKLLKGFIPVPETPSASFVKR